MGWEAVSRVARLHKKAREPVMSHERTESLLDRELQTSAEASGSVGRWSLFGTLSQLMALSLRLCASRAERGRPIEAVSTIVMPERKWWYLPPATEARTSEERYSTTQDANSAMAHCAPRGACRARRNPRRRGALFARGLCSATRGSRPARTETLFLGVCFL